MWVGSADVGGAGGHDGVAPAGGIGLWDRDGRAPGAWQGEALGAFRAAAEVRCPGKGEVGLLWGPVPGSGVPSRAAARLALRDSGGLTEAGGTGVLEGTGASVTGNGAQGVPPTLVEVLGRGLRPAGRAW